MTEVSVALLARLPGCARLEAPELAVLDRAATPVEFAAATVLVAQGEPAPDWYAVVECGAVQLSQVDLESREILDFLTPGDVIDAGTPGAPAPFSAVAVERSRCVLVPQEVVAHARESARPGTIESSRGELALLVSRIQDLLSGPPVCCGPDTRVADAARLMSQRRVGSIVVVQADGTPIGIVTDRDLRNRIVAAGRSPTVPVTEIFSAPLVSIRPGALAFDGLLDMTRHNIHHLVVQQDGRLLGVVSSHDLIWLQGTHPVALARDIEVGGSVDELAEVAPRIQAVVQWLAGVGAGVFEIGQIAAELNDRLVRRVLAVVEADLEAEGHGRAPVPYSWLAAGSEGRREQTLKTDQDNGLVYEDPAAEAAEPARAYFGVFAGRAAAALVRLGFPACDGGYMASNPRWCQPASVWSGYFESWMDAPHPERVLSACIYFDLRPIGRSSGPGARLWQWVCAHAPSRKLFLRYLARAATERQPPLGLFGGFVVERTGVHKDQLDLKARGVLPVTQAMRAYALAMGVAETNTVERLLRLGERDVFAKPAVRDLREAYEVVSRIRLEHQLACLAAGRAPDNFVNPHELGKADRLLLKEAFKTIGWLQRTLEDRFQTAMIP
jgi:CBS domain-containing protein